MRLNKQCPEDDSPLGEQTSIEAHVFCFIINANMRGFGASMIRATISSHYVMGIPLQHRNLGDASLPRIDST
jgi:hypothetical protein